ncbi:ABC-2 type transport system permease protein [Allocatelliglobosispora scoriae]|uniref:ABC-2 type transport system permease protein n=1 Tax=Allocatelliglobosispora scoriae TaxID=643052 RepID=A0A841BKP7_9ACTN|nr:ABC transporter permease [Allocatelliglobosispora scoriae]MBB5867573.1 ABC-2 type transport system permease protein [Allocatelliglobosispora scoriae]
MSATHQPVTPWGAVRLVAGREVKTRLGSKAFRITTIAMLLVVIGFVLTLKLSGGSSGSEVGFTAASAPVAGQLQAAAVAVGTTVTTRTVDAAEGDQLVRDGELDAFVTGTPGAFQVVVRKDLSSELTRAFTVLVQQQALYNEITRVGGDPAAVDAAVRAAAVTITRLEPASEYQTERLVLGIIAGILVYLSLMIYGQVVAQGVVEEKANRIVESLLTTIRPWQLLLGKVVGIGAVGLGQLIVVAAAGIGFGLAFDVIDFPASIATGAAIWTVVWFLLGFLVYALMFAALGALVSRQEDVAGATAPALFLIILPYILGISILPSDPDNPMLTIASLIPFFSPTLMPMRIAMGVAPVWQIALSVVLTIGLVVGLLWLAARIYRNAVLRTGSKVRLRDALRAAS